MGSLKHVQSKYRQETLISTPFSNTSVRSEAKAWERPIMLASLERTYHVAGIREARRRVVNECLKRKLSMKQYIPFFRTGKYKKIDIDNIYQGSF